MKRTIVRTDPETAMKPFEFRVKTLQQLQSTLCSPDQALHACFWSSGMVKHSCASHEDVRVRLHGRIESCATRSHHPLPDRSSDCERPASPALAEFLATCRCNVSLKSNLGIWSTWRDQDRLVDPQRRLKLGMALGLLPLAIAPREFEAREDMLSSQWQHQFV